MHASASTRSPSRRRARLSAGILPYRRRRGTIEVFIVHPGGPFFASGRKQAVWNLGKGGVETNEAPFDAALREFAEETGYRLPRDRARYLPLGEVRYPSGKRVVAWSLHAPSLDPHKLSSMEVCMTWRGKRVCFPEVDRAMWVPVSEARRLLFPPLRSFLDRLERILVHKKRRRTTPAATNRMGVAPHRTQRA